MTSAMGRGGVLLTIVAAIAMSALTFFFDSPHPLTVPTGLCLKSPSMWNLIPIASWAINIALLLATGAGLSLINKTFSIVPGSSSILPGIFIIMSTSIPWIGGTVTSSSILCFTMLICLALLFSSYRSFNATQEIFVIATIVSVGSMIQYGFIFMLIPLIIIAILFKCFRFREAMAMILGLIAPYWVVLGLGIVKISNFRFPELANIFDGAIAPNLLFTGLINIGFTAVLTFILGLYNLAKLYAGNTRRRMFNLAFSILGIASLVCMVVDSDNLSAYLVTFFMSAAMQYADIFALWNIRRPWAWSLTLCLIYISFFAISISN